MTRADLLRAVGREPLFSTGMLLSPGVSLQEVMSNALTPGLYVSLEFVPYSVRAPAVARALEDWVNFA